ncbi:MAG: hypothetical protein GX558_07890, partial [Clostridiales bacterium]|nr:hypothetical protein [Clostridiales bacterium]
PYRGADIYWESFNAAELERPAQETDFSVLETGEGQIYRPEDGVVLCCLCQKGDEECR